MHSVEINMHALYLLHDSLGLGVNTLGALWLYL